MTCVQYRHIILQICKYDIEQSISREMSGDLKEGMVAIGKSAIKIVIEFNLFFSEVCT